MNVTVDQLEAEFKKFGPIKQEGVQVRSNRQQGSCYGFVEFLYASSMESAIQASPVIVRGRQAFVEVKRTTTRVDGGRGRFPPGRGGFRGDNFRGRGSYGGGRGYARNDFGGRGEYSSRGRGLAGRAGEGYQRGRGRATRQSGMNRHSVAT
uniref:RRM domain-containing protein n=1 Tax=Opuntia streptacantha TaxID=393608 RepID=A0A7C9CFF9_OPUST